MNTLFRSADQESKYQNLLVRIELEQIELGLAHEEAERQLQCLQRHEFEGEVRFDSLREDLTERIEYYKQRLIAVRKALHRFRSGQFGVCISCGKDIGKRRLQALPTALRCLRCEQRMETARGQNPKEVANVAGR